jgi:Toprim domain
MSARGSICELARRLAREAEAACRHYLPKGRRQGNYWTVGDAAGTPGRSLYVRLKGPDSGKGAAGKWTDAASGEHGDLLDLIALNRELRGLRDAMEEARDFLRLPRRAPTTSPTSCPSSQAAPGSTEAARRLFAASKPIAGTIAETYLRARGIDSARGLAALRFHPRCYYYGDDRVSAAGRARTYPALIAAVTDDGANFVAVHRTWIDPGGAEKAHVAAPRRAMGPLLGNGVRFGKVTSLSPILIAGEGIETILSLRMAMPLPPMISAGSANHLAAILFPQALQRLYIAVDDDLEGWRACERLRQRALDAGLEALPLTSTLGDFNDDLRRLGLATLREGLARQLLTTEAERFLSREG